MKIPLSVYIYLLSIISMACLTTQKIFRFSFIPAQICVAGLSIASITLSAQLIPVIEEYGAISGGSSGVAYATSVWIVVMGCAGLVLAGTGIALAVRQTPMLTAVYSIVGILSACGLMSSATYQLNIADDLVDMAADNMVYHITHNTTIDQEWLMINQLQRQESCCGGKGYQDWLLPGAPIFGVPKSCCTLNALYNDFSNCNNVTTTTTPTTINYTPKDDIAEETQDHYTSMDDFSEESQNLTMYNSRKHNSLGNSKSLKLDPVNRDINSRNANSKIKSTTQFYGSGTLKTKMSKNVLTFSSPNIESPEVDNNSKTKFTQDNEDVRPSNIEDVSDINISTRKVPTPLETSRISKTTKVPLPHFKNAKLETSTPPLPHFNSAQSQGVSTTLASTEAQDQPTYYTRGCAEAYGEDLGYTPQQAGALGVTAAIGMFASIICVILVLGRPLYDVVSMRLRLMS